MRLENQMVSWPFETACQQLINHRVMLYNFMDVMWACAHSRARVFWKTYIATTGSTFVGLLCACLL